LVCEVAELPLPPARNTYANIDATTLMSSTLAGAQVQGPVRLPIVVIT
jgi:hypothetical protein